MNVSKPNLNSTSFGSIKKSAVEHAIANANGDISGLDVIKNTIEEQKSNYRYDIVGLPPGEYYTYMVVKRGENSGMCFDRLHEACKFATESARRDEYIEKLETIKAEQKPEFDKLASELTDSCED